MGKLKGVFGITEADLFGGSDDIETKDIAGGRKFPRAKREPELDVSRDRSRRPEDRRNWLYDHFSEKMKNAIMHAKINDDKELAAAVSALGEVMAVRFIDYRGSMGTDKDTDRVISSLDNVVKSFEGLLDAYSDAEMDYEMLNGDEEGEPEKATSRRKQGAAPKRTMGTRRMA